MRYVLGVLLRALGVALMVRVAFPLVGCGGSPSNSFEIIRDQQKQSYDSTRITLKEEDSQLVLLAWNTANSNYKRNAVHLGVPGRFPFAV